MLWKNAASFSPPPEVRKEWNKGDSPPANGRESNRYQPDAKEGGAPGRFTTKEGEHSDLSSSTSRKNQETSTISSQEKGRNRNISTKRDTVAPRKGR